MRDENNGIREHTILPGRFIRYIPFFSLFYFFWVFCTSILRSSIFCILLSSLKLALFTSFLCSSSLPEWGLCEPRDGRGGTVAVGWSLRVWVLSRVEGCGSVRPNLQGWCEIWWMEGSWGLRDAGGGSHHVCVQFWALIDEVKGHQLSVAEFKTRGSSSSSNVACLRSCDLAAPIG